MKKILISLGIIALVAVLGISVVFAYGSYKDLELKKEEAKLDHKKSKDKQKENHKVASQTNNDEQTPLENTVTQQVEPSQPIDNTAKTDGNTKENVNMDNDYNGDGAISKDEMTPEQEKLFKEGKFQPTKAEYGQDIENNEASTSANNEKPNPDNMSDEEFLNAYKEGMPEEDAQTVDDMSKDPAYIDYLRGQVEARENGQGGNY